MLTFDLSSSFPTDPVYVFLFTEVENAIELRSKLLAGDSDYLYAFLDAGLIVSQLQVLAAVNRALHDHHYGNMRTKHLHSEIVYALAATQNIAEAFKTFGLNDSTKNVIVVKVTSAAADEVSEHVRKIVLGKEASFDDVTIQSCTDIAKVRKYYKLGSSNGKRKADEDQSRWDDPDECTKVIIGSIALRGSS